MPDAPPNPSPAAVIASALKAAGIRPLAKQLGFESHMRVWKWAQVGRIPSRHWDQVNAGIAALGGVPIPTETLQRAQTGESP